MLKYLIATSLSLLILFLRCLILFTRNVKLMPKNNYWKFFLKKYLEFKIEWKVLISHNPKRFIQRLSSTIS